MNGTCKIAMLTTLYLLQWPWTLIAFRYFFCELNLLLTVSIIFSHQFCPKFRLRQSNLVVRNSIISLLLCYQLQDIDIPLFLLQMHLWKFNKWIMMKLYPVKVQLVYLFYEFCYSLFSNFPSLKIVIKYVLEVSIINGFLKSINDKWMARCWKLYP